MQPKIVVIGSLNMDLVVQAPHIPLPGETIIGSRYRTASGGKGANQAVAAARMGGKVAMIGRVGEDAYGRALRAGLEADKIDTHAIYTDSSLHTGVAFIIVEDGGENSIVVSPGANWQVSEQDIDRNWASIQDGQVIVLQLEIPLATVEHTIQRAASAAIPVILNPAPARPLAADLLKNIKYLILNETETAILTGIDASHEASMRSAVDVLHQMGVENVIITLGEQGSFFSSHGTQGHMPAYPVQAVDTTGAGDAFVGAFAVGISTDKPLEEAIRFASAAGALATTRFGAQPSLPYLAEVEELIRHSTHN